MQQSATITIIMFCAYPRQKSCTSNEGIGIWAQDALAALGFIDHEFNHVKYFSFCDRMANLIHFEKNTAIIRTNFFKRCSSPFSAAWTDNLETKGMLKIKCFRPLRIKEADLIVQTVRYQRWACQMLRAIQL